ncbi:MAG: hypothetical protein SVK08_10425 [Halobacteriota archaeon]|nr:hypothetical protein [Halobacteriota archaeon]
MKDRLSEKEAQWLNHIKQWSTSELSQTGYCRVHNLTPRQFGYYKRKFDQAEDSKIVELKKVRYHAGAFVELVTPDGLMLRFREDIPPANFRNMIMSLRG